MKTKTTPADMIGGALARARELRPRLDAATDHLNTTIEKVEEALAALKMGVRVQTAISDDEDFPFYQLLVFGKWSNQWRLLVESGSEEDPDRSETSLLTSASREMRLRALEHLPHLIEALSKTMQSELERVEGAAKAAEQLVEKLQDGVP